MDLGAPSGSVIGFKRRQFGETGRREGDIWQQWTTSFGVQNGGGRGSFPGRAVAAAQHHPSEEHVGKQFMATVPQSAACTIHASSLMGLTVRGRNLSETTTKNDNMQNHLDQRLFRQELADPLIDSPKERRSQCVVTCVVTNVRRRSGEISSVTTAERQHHVSVCSSRPACRFVIALPESQSWGWFRPSPSIMQSLEPTGRMPCDGSA
mgnify:CR=1 FL=1